MAPTLLVVLTSIKRPMKEARNIVRLKRQTEIEDGFNVCM